MMDPLLKSAMEDLPLVAILRGIAPERAVDVGEILLSTGFSMIEVPLNSPDPFDSIRRLAEALGDRALIGAGTVLDEESARRVADAGGRLIVMPHGDVAVIRAAKDADCIAMPGFMTPTEAFAAIDAGADALKVFPAELVPPVGLKAMRAVLSPDMPLLPVGGIDAGNMDGYWAAGAKGFGLGSSLFKADYSDDEIAERADRLVAAMRALMK